MNKKRIRARTYSMERLRIMRGQELERQAGRKIEIPDYIYERIKNAEEQMEAGSFFTWEEVEARLGIIRYGKRGIAYRKFRNKRWKARHKRDAGNGGNMSSS